MIVSMICLPKMSKFTIMRTSKNVIMSRIGWNGSLILLSSMYRMSALSSSSSRMRGNAVIKISTSSVGCFRVTEMAYPSCSRSRSCCLKKVLPEPRVSSRTEERNTFVSVNSFVYVILSANASEKPSAL